MIEYFNRRTSRSPDRPDADAAASVVLYSLSAAVWTAAAILAMVILGGIFAFVLVPPLGFLAPFVGFVVILVIATTLRETRRRKATAALMYVEQAVRLNLPLAPMLASARLAEHHGVALRINRVEELLAAGSTVADALAYGLPELPARSATLAIAAERLGRLPQALRRIVDDQRPRAELNDPTRVFYRTYPLLLLAVCSFVIMMLAIFVMPKFQQLFRDFQIELPPATQKLLTIAEYLGPTVFTVSAILVLLLAGRALWEAAVPNRRKLGLRWLTDRVEWNLPLLGRAASDRGAADVCWLLAGAVEGGLTLDRAIEESELLDVNLLFAGNLKRWRQLIQQGTPLPDAARAAGLPHLMVGMLNSAASTADLPTLLRFLSRYYASRFSRLQALLRGAYVPIAALLMGLVVYAVALSMFQPMTALINTLSPHVTGAL